MLKGRGLYALLVICLGLVCLTIPRIPKAYACGCARPTPAESLRASDAVFAGEVIATAEPGRGFILSRNFPFIQRDPIRSNADPVHFTFRVSKVWKGLNQPHIVVTSAGGGGTCGYDFGQVGGYLVYATEKQGRLTTNTCTGTKHLLDSDEDLRVLGQGIVPAADNTTSFAAQPLTLATFIVAGSVVVLSVLAFVLLFGIRRATAKNTTDLD